MELTPLRDAGLAVSTDRMDLVAARRDLWPRDTLRMRDGDWPDAPMAVVWPTSTEQVRRALDWAVEQGVCVVPYGGGSGVCGGAAGRGGSLVIDTKRMRRVLAFDPEARTVRVETGILGQHLEDWLARHGWMTAHSPSSIMTSTVGGWIATRSAGQFSSRYGVFDDMLLAVRMEAPAGTVPAGIWTPPGDEDLLPAIAGSEGALGVVTEALVRVARLPEHRWLRAYAFPGLRTAWGAMRALLQADLWPSALRLYDPLDTRIGGPARAVRHIERHGHELLSRLRAVVEQVPGLRRHLLDLPLALPGLVNRLAQGLGGEVLLVVGFEGPREVVEAQVRAARPMLDAGRDLGAGPAEYWFAHRHDVSYKLAPIFAAGGWADTMEVAAPWSRLAVLYEQVREALARHALVMAHFSHAYPEGCSIYFSFAGTGTPETYDATWREALQAARLAGGTVSHHHGVGQLKAEEAAREAGAAVRVWREIAAALDPDRCMNPGRLFPSDIPLAPGPPRPVGGPVYRVDAISRLAEVDPLAPPSELEAELARRGFALRIRPDRPLGRWLARLQRGVLDRWETPLFAIQARFEDGVSVRIGDAPRSAAGPDLRWGLLRRAHPEMVQVPVRPLDEVERVVRPRRSLHANDVRPAWRAEDGRWGFAGPAARALAAVVDGEPARGGQPRRRPTLPRVRTAPSLPAGGGS